MNCIESQKGLIIEIKNNEQFLVKSLINDESIIISCKNRKLYIDGVEKIKLENYVIQEKILLGENSIELDKYIEKYLKKLIKINYQFF